MPFRAGANNKGNSAAPTVTIPAGAVTGDVVLIVATQGNSDVQTSFPSDLTLLDAQLQGTSMSTRIYRGVIGTGALVAGAVLSFPLSTTRQWGLDLVVWSSTSTAAPEFQVAAAVSSSLVTPTLNTSSAGDVLEILVGKSNGTTITTITPPAGWTSRQMQAATNTFGPAAIIAERTANPSAASTYGGETYTASSTPNVTVRYTLRLAPAVKSVSLTPATETDAAVPVARSKPRTIAPATETSNVVPLGRIKTRKLTPAAEISTATPLRRVKQLALVVATEASTAVALARRRLRSLVPASESDAAGTLTRRRSRTVTPATEANSTPPLIRRRSRNLAPAGEADTAAPVVDGSPTDLALTPAPETDTATGIRRTKRRTLTPAATPDMATALQRVRSRTLAPSTETGTTPPVGRTKLRDLAAAAETALVEVLRSTKARILAPAGESDQAIELILTTTPGIPARDITFYVGDPHGHSLAVQDPTGHALRTGEPTGHPVLIGAAAGHQLHPGDPTGHPLTIDDPRS